MSDRTKSHRRLHESAARPRRPDNVPPSLRVRRLSGVAGAATNVQFECTVLLMIILLYIHGAIHEKAPHARCIFHVHSKYATALSTLKDPVLKPIDQNTMMFYNRVSTYNEFGGLGLEDESIKMANSLGNKQHMLLANHGILTTGETVAEGFNSLYYFERAAQTYLTALSTNQELNVVSHEVAEKTAEEHANFPTDFANLFLSQIRLILDKEEPDYKN